MSSLLTPEIIQSVLALLGILLTALIGRVARSLDRRWGVELDEKAQRTLHSALSTGALIAWSRMDPDVQGPKPTEMIDIVVEHVLGDGAQDAVKRLSASPNSIRKMAEAKLTEVGASLNAAVPKALGN